MLNERSVPDALVTFVVLALLSAATPALAQHEDER